MTPEVAARCESLLAPPVEWTCDRMLAALGRRRVRLAYGASLRGLEGALCREQTLMTSSTFPAYMVVSGPKADTLSVVLQQESPEAIKLMGYVHGLVAQHFASEGHSQQPGGTGKSCTEGKAVAPLQAKAIERARAWMEEHYNVFLQRMESSGWLLDQVNLPNITYSMGSGKQE